MNILFHISVFVHILSAMAWIGGSLFLVMVLMPALRNPALAPHSREILAATGQKFKKVGWHCLGTLIITGIINIAYKPGFDEIFNMKNPANHVLWTKIMLVILILIFSAAHDDHLGKKALEAWERDPESPQTHKLRKQARLMGRLTLGLGVLVVLLASFLTRGIPG